MPARVSADDAGVVKSRGQLFKPSQFGNLGAAFGRIIPEDGLQWTEHDERGGQLVGMRIAQALVEVADGVVGRAIEHAGEGESDIVRSVGPLLITADALLGE